MELDRRDFLKTAGAVAVAGAAATPALAAEAAQEPEWNAEVEFLVVGTGCAFFVPFMLEKIGANWLAVEARGVYGGTMAMSGAGCWVPRNHLMDEEGYVDLEIDEIKEYVHECDLFGNVDDYLLDDYLVNCPVAFKYMADEIDVATCYSNIPDYYNREKGEFTGRRKLDFCPAGDPSVQGSAYFNQVIFPRVAEEPYASKILYNTTAEKLVTDESGAVIGVMCTGPEGPCCIKTTKGVLLDTGGFDWNPQMRKEYLRFPIFASNAVETDNGSGHRMAREVGADFGNMGCVWGLPFFAMDKDYSTAQHWDIMNQGWDWFFWRGQANSIIVNREGRRFTNEQATYPATYFNYFEYDIRTNIWRNLPATFIFDSDYIENIGWPQGVPEQPEWISGPYETLEELAEDWGIDPEGLVDEVAIFNGYCEVGKDPQFDRGGWPWDQWVAELRISPYRFPDFREEWEPLRTDLANTSLGPIAKAPFYACQIVPGCCGTCGGPKINRDAQILDAEGNPIPGLYGAGNLVANVFGSGYPGSGATEGPGCYYSWRAVNHAFGLGLTKEV